LPSQEVWKARGGTLPRPWPAPEVREIEPGFTFEGQGWALRSCEVPHAQPALQCMGFAVESEGRKFVYSGDAGINDGLTGLARDADLLLHWCYRLDGENAHPMMRPLTPTPTEIAEMAKGAGVRHLALTHFRVHMDQPERHAAALDALCRTFGERCCIVEDLDEITV
jgi:ribonuclease BN (tRNA processing enzyme)